MATQGAEGPFLLGESGGMLLPKELKSRSSEMRFPAFQASKKLAVFVGFKNFSGRYCCFICFLLLLLISFLFSLMKFKQTEVKGPTGSSRLPVTSFY